MDRNATNPDQLTESPQKKRPNSMHNTVFVDNFDKCVIKNTIQDFCMYVKKVPTIPTLFPIIKKINKLSFGKDVIV